MPDDAGGVQPGAHHRNRRRRATGLLGPCGDQVPEGDAGRLRLGSCRPVGVASKIAGTGVRLEGSRRWDGVVHGVRADGRAVGGRLPSGQPEW